MAQPPKFGGLRREDFPDAPEWFDKLANALNPALQDTTAALSGRLSLTDNLACAVNTFQFTMPTTDLSVLPYARYTSSTATSIPNGADTLVNYGNLSLDSHSAVTTGASWRFTCPAGHGGIYRVEATVMFEGGTATDASMQLYKNGSSYSQMSGRRPLSASFSSIWGSDCIQLVAGDYIDIRVAQFSGVARALWSDANFNHVNITRQYTGPVANNFTPSCFPLTYKAAIKGAAFKPTAVLIGSLRDTESGAVHQAGTPSWEWDGKGNVRILNIPGLTYGRTYEVTFLTF